MTNHREVTCGEWILMKWNWSISVNSILKSYKEIWCVNFFWWEYIISVKHHNMVFQMAYISHDLLDRNWKTENTKCKNYYLAKCNDNLNLTLGTGFEKLKLWDGYDNRKIAQPSFCQILVPEVYPFLWKWWMIQNCDRDSVS